MDQPECINQSIDLFWVVLIIVILMIIMNLVQRLISGWVLKESQFNDNIQWLLLDTRRSYIHITVEQIQRNCTCPCADIFYYALCRCGRGTSPLQPPVKNFGIFQKKTAAWNRWYKCCNRVEVKCCLDSLCSCSHKVLGLIVRIRVKFMGYFVRQLKFLSQVSDIR